MYLHFRDNNPQVKSIWKTVHQDIVTSINLICTQVNQCLLLNDLYDTRLCNRLLEPESTEDIFRDSLWLHQTADIFKFLKNKLSADPNNSVIHADNLTSIKTQLK